jgi:phosphoribosylanthranilate isomerase
MKVKICGITDRSTGLQAIQLGADALGFVFAESKRRVNVSQAKEIIKDLPVDLMKIGVFVNETKQVMEETATILGLTHLQLHGDEDPEFCANLSLPVIKAFSIKTESDFERVRKYSCEYILLDSSTGQYRGGNGTTFNWNLVKEKSLGDRKVILAGGLYSENVEDAIAVVNPYMVDVSSGVETDGKKDLEKIKTFIELAKRGVDKK